MPKTFFQKLGFGNKPRGRPSTRKVEIVWNRPLQSTSLVGRKKKTDFTFTKREKKIAVANLEGAGAGFVLGTALGGFGGMVVGVPLGTLAGNVIGTRMAGKPRGRPMKYVQKQNFFGRMLSTKAERIAYDKKMLALERKKK